MVNITRFLFPNWISPEEAKTVLLTPPDEKTIRHESARIRDELSSPNSHQKVIERINKTLYGGANFNRWESYNPQDIIEYHKKYYQEHSFYSTPAILEDNTPLEMEYQFLKFQTDGMILYSFIFKKNIQTQWLLFFLEKFIDTFSRSYQSIKFSKYWTHEFSCLGWFEKHGSISIGARDFELFSDPLFSDFIQWWIRDVTQDIRWYSQYPDMESWLSEEYRFHINFGGILPVEQKIEILRKLPEFISHLNTPLS